LAWIVLNGTVFGYDPGGKGAHGTAELNVVGGQTRSLIVRAASSVEEVIRRFENVSAPLAIGVDSLTCWSAGEGGWRPADRWLRQQYPEVSSSVMAPNSLRSSMTMGGMVFLIAARQRLPSIPVTETHPKVLSWHLSRAKYDYAAGRATMDAALRQLLGFSVIPENEHEWDAALSAFAALEGISNRWRQDLHALPVMPGERVIVPCGTTNYFWPD
jgi:hypothetical protein